MKEIFVDVDSKIIIIKPKKGKLAKLLREASGHINYDEVRKIRDESETSLKRKAKDLI